MGVPNRALQLKELIAQIAGSGRARYLDDKITVRDRDFGRFADLGFYKIFDHGNLRWFGIFAFTEDVGE